MRIGPSRVDFKRQAYNKDYRYYALYRVRNGVVVRMSPIAVDMSQLCKIVSDVRGIYRAYPRKTPNVRHNTYEYEICDTKLVLWTSSEVHITLATVDLQSEKFCIQWKPFGRLLNKNQRMYLQRRLKDKYEQFRKGS